MNRLQLYITSSYKGYKPVLRINAAADIEQHVTDLTEAVENVSFLQSEKHTFYLLKYIEDGTFITVMRTIPNCGCDHLAAWLFVPAEIDIRANDLTGVVSVVSGILSNPAISVEDAGRLEHLLQRTYPEAAQRGCMVQNYGVQYAHRYYGSDTGMRLTDLIGDMRYQTAYLPYAGVILADKDDVNEIEGADLTGRSLKRMVPMLPPDPTDGPYQPTIFNLPFEAPYLVPLGSVVEVLWTALGREALVQTVDVLRADMKPSIPGEIAQRHDGHDAAGSADHGTPVAEPVFLDPEPEPEPAADEPAPEAPSDPEPATVAEPEPATVAEPEPQSAPAEPESAEMADESSLESATSPCGFAARDTAEKPQKRVYVFEAPSSSTAIGHMVHFEILSRSPIIDSPLEGYEPTAEIQEGPSRVNRLEYVGPDGIRRRQIMWALAGMACGIILTLLASLACSRGHSSPAAPAQTDSVEAQADSAKTAAAVTPVDNKDAQAQAQAQAPAQTAQPAAADIAAAVSYLDSHSTWTKADMEKNPALSGLYDDLNQYRLPVIIDKWGPMLKASQSFTKLVGHCQGALRARKLEKNNVKPPYTDSGSIAVYPWECKVDK